MVPSVVGVAEGEEVGVGVSPGSAGRVSSVVGLDRGAVSSVGEVTSGDPSPVGAAVGFKSGLGEKNGSANPPQAVEFPCGEVVGLVD